MNVVWRPQASREFSEIVAHLHEQSPAGAARIYEQILHSVSFLADWPMMGRAARRGNRELVIPHTPYVVIFKVEKNVVRIRRVLHGSRRR